MKTYGVMLIGCGHIGMEHLQDIYWRDNVRVEVVIDSNPERAQMAARRCGAQWDADYRPHLQNPNIDIVIIATYASSHLSILLDCLAHHKHVLCEKPIALNLEDGQTFVDAVKAAPEKVLVAHILRHNRTYQKIHDLIHAGAIGTLRLVRMTQNHHASGPEWARHCRLMEDCSPTVDCGVHYYDVAQWMADSPITEITGFGTKTQPDAPRENYTMVTFRMENGCSGFYEVGWGESLRTCNMKEFIGTAGRITLQMNSQRGEDLEEGDLLTVYHSDTGVYETINVQSKYKDMYTQLKMLIDMIEGTTVGSPTIDDVWQAFRIAKAAEQSIVEGVPISISQ